mgnify:CR=1 FL=1
MSSDKDLQRKLFSEDLMSSEPYDFDEDNIQDEVKTAKNLIGRVYSELQSNINFKYSELFEKDASSKSQPLVGVNENWSKIKNYDARVIEIRKSTIKLDCLVDRENKKFQTRLFDKSLFTNIHDLKAGKYILVRVFKKPGKISFTINNGEKLVDKRNFENHPEFSDLDDIEHKTID